ncbi:archaemetzincin [Lishizhenia tianjinensis]|uniref:Archaemetzincin n=1 Tax=Lishizhenia tianjinensis TaxID=477690 RepID=A0A1I6XFB5_9FLAO|nr:matrixin family metalloprotease [Lishizhenia tianjinensis]SFT36995.1 archaemetzincin [Lishizhenia tianjinensis]
MKTILSLVLVAFFLSACSSNQPLKIAIQPFEGVNQVDVELIKSSLAENYKAKVYVLETMDIPQSTFTHVKTPRYRADQLIAFLKENKKETIDHIIGLIAKDISTTKKNADGSVKEPASKYKDWGIFGLGYRPGVSCIVSTYRLSKRRPDRRSQLIKIANHEIGHNLGLSHCDRTSDCVMRDAAESIKTIDKVGSTLCTHCKEDIK